MIRAADSASSIPTVYDSDQRAEAVALALMHAQKGIHDLQVQQRLNGDEDDAPIPGAEPRAGAEQPQTYAERRAQLEDGCRLLMEDNAGVREEIEAVAAKWRAERDQQRASQSTRAQGD